MSAGPIERASALLEQGQAAQALEISTRLVSGGGASHSAFVIHSTALKALHRHEEALACDLQAARRFPTSGVAYHNLAATLGDLGRGEEALQALEKGFSFGLDSAVSWKVKARAHLAVGELGAAEAAFRQALRRAPDDAETAWECADLIWMARGDMAEAQALLDGAFQGGAPPVPLLLAKAKLWEAGGDRERATGLLVRAVQQLPGEPDLVSAAAQAMLQAGRLAEAERLAQHAHRLRPESVAALVQLTVIDLAQGRADTALSRMRHALEGAPLDQSVLAWTATAARAAGDPLYGELCDYESMVGVYDVEPPADWGGDEPFLTALTAALDRHHVMKEHPASQSLRSGTQTTYRLTGSKEPAVRAFFTAVDRVILDHLARLGAGADPLRRRNTGAYRMVGAWSVRLRPGGFHLDHMHQEGWLSSAFYVETPDRALEGEDRAGWLRLGKPPYKTEPELPAERFVRPKPGRLALFPSYMWHGTVPFETDERRLTIAFDLLPG